MWQWCRQNCDHDDDKTLTMTFDNDDKTMENGKMMIIKTKWRNDWADNDNMKITIKIIQQWQ